MRNLKALFCLVISNHLTLITNTSSLFIYYTISFGYRQPTFISHLLIGLSPFTFLEDGRLLSEEIKFISLTNFTYSLKKKTGTFCHTTNNTIPPSTKSARQTIDTYT